MRIQIFLKIIATFSVQLKSILMKHVRRALKPFGDRNATACQMLVIITRHLIARLRVAGQIFQFYLEDRCL